MDLSQLMSFIIWVVFYLQRSSDATALLHECQRDTDCSAINFCDPSSLLCETCIPCQSIFNRAMATDIRSCAKSEDDCGSCLPGYQSEDWTNQRRSYKCYPIRTDKQFEFPYGVSHMISWNDVTSLSAAIILLAAILVGFATYYLKSLNNNHRESLTIASTSKTFNESDTLPPPYHLVRSSKENYTLVAMEPEHENQATPIGRYHMSRREDDLDPDDLEFEQAVAQSDAGSMLESTETIPSTWEPSSVTVYFDDIPGHQHNPFRPLRRQSQASFNLVSTLLSRSCPDLPGSISTGTYQYRHVFLSNWRQALVSDRNIEKKIENRLSESLHSFLLDETEQPQESDVNRARTFLRSLSAPGVSYSSQRLEVLDPYILLRTSRRRVNENTQTSTAMSNKRRRKE